MRERYLILTKTDQEIHIQPYILLLQTSVDI